LAALAAVALGASRDPSATMVLLCVLAVVLAAAGVVLGLWALAYRRLCYALTESALRVEWLGRTLVVPYAAIHGIYAGQRLSGNATPGRPIWPGVNVGTRRVRGMGKLRFFATSSDQSELTLITVENGGVVISARDPAEFQTALIEQVESSVEDEAATWHDRAAADAPWTAVADAWLPLGVGVGAIVLLAILAVIDMRYADLPSEVAMHFDVGGEPTQIGPKSDLLRLPLLGLLVLVLNWAVGVVVHPRERVLARLMWLVAIVVQVVLLIGVIRIVA
jgi:uncharacterized protein DUF1648/PH (Pleckstrin Homology) domain-containing protein